MSSQFRFFQRQNPLTPKTKITIGNDKFTCSLNAHFISEVLEIKIKDDPINRLCLTLLQNGQVTVSAQKIKEFKKRCVESFAVDPKLDKSQTAISVMTGSSDKDIKSLDYFSFEQLAGIISSAFDSTSVKLHSKILRKLKLYAKFTQRSQAEKTLIQNLLKIYKESEDIQQDQEDNKLISPKKGSIQKSEQSEIATTVSDNSRKNKKKSEQKQVQKETTTKQYQNDFNESKLRSNFDKNNEKPTRKQKKQAQKNEQSDSNQNNDQQKPQRKRNSRSSQRGGRQSYGKRNQSNDKWQSRNSMSKQKIDSKILLGIHGDTEFGWRQRNRPTKVPSREQDQELKQIKSYKKTQQKKSYNHQKVQQSAKIKAENVQKIEKSQKPAVPHPKKQQKIALEAVPDKTNDEGLKLIYVYPNNGQDFNFSKVKDDFSLFINGKFWIKYNNKSLKIEKGQNGYIRDSGIDCISNGFMAEGLTVKLDGSSNIEDGGDTFGSPSIEDFTGSSNQFFHIVTMQVYAPQ